MFEEVENSQAKTQDDSAALLAGKRKELLPHIARLEEAHKAFREVLPAARKCLEAVGELQHSGRTILKGASQELQNHADGGEIQFGQILKGLKFPTLADFERPPYASNSKVDGAVGQVAGTCGIAGRMKQLIKQISFDMGRLKGL